MIERRIRPRALCPHDVPPLRASTLARARRLVGPFALAPSRATLSCAVTWSSSQVALGVAGLALLLAIGCWLFTWMAIWRERARRSRRVKEAVYEWAGGAATKADLEEVAELRRAVSELAERLTSLEAEQQSQAESRRFS
jgi:type VI protein secretion system component VasK